MSFPSALAVGIEGVDEVMELELAEACQAEPLARRLARCAVSGLEFRSVEILPPQAAKARVRSASYEVPIPENRRAEAAEQVARLLAAESRPVQRPGKARPLDLRPFVEELAIAGGVLRMRLAVRQEAAASARDVLADLRLADLEHSGARLRRTAVHLET